MDTADANSTAVDDDSQENLTFENVHRFSTPRFWITSFIQIAFVLFLYVLSAGPMYWVIYEAYNHDGSAFVAQLYLPLTLACERSEMLNDFMQWYVGLWVF